MGQATVANGVRKLIAGAVVALLFLLLLPAVAFAADEDYTVSVEKGYLALRTEPALDENNEIGSLYTGDKVVVREKGAGQYWWVYAPKFGKEGYVNKDFLKPSPSQEAPSSTGSYGDYRVKVDKGYLALRTAPDFKYENEIGQLYTGDIVSVLDKSNDKYWWVYSPKYGREGYVDKAYLTTEAPHYGDYQVKVDKGYLALRTAPDFARENEIGELNTGDVVTLKEKRGKYWWVYSPRLGKEGYVDSNFLVKI